MRSLFSSFQPLMNWLCSTLPAFPVRADQVSVLYKPDEFFETLMKSCSYASKRILLASLYLGTGEKEKQLVNVIMSRVKEQGSSLKVKVLLDAMRGSRGENNSRKMLLPLIKQSTQCQVALFHSPKLTGLLRHCLPIRYNEMAGLQHMKIYVVDDDVLISGANLSHNYFTNRQDRYIVVKDCKPLADFFDGMVNILCDMSFQLDVNNDISLLAKYHPYNQSKMYVNELKNRISKYYSSFVTAGGGNFDESDTWIFPTIEVPPCGIHIDSEVTKYILNSVPQKSVVYLASGYFNLTDGLVQIILSSKAEYDILMAHPTTNGFYQSKGFSKYIPDVYTILAKQFLELLEKQQDSNRVRMFEFQKRGWTYHGKGIWITFPREVLPHLTIVGSSNYGARSEIRDMEAQLIIVTDDFELKKKLYREQRQLFDYGSNFSWTVILETERRIPFWMNGLSWLLKSFF